VKGVVTPLRPVPSTIAAPDYSHVEQYDLEGYDRTRSHVNSDENVVIWGDEDVRSAFVSLLRTTEQSPLDRSPRFASRAASLSRSSTLAAPS